MITIQSIIIIICICLLFWGYMSIPYKENYQNYNRQNHVFVQHPSLTLSSDHEKLNMLRHVCKLPCK